MADHTHTQIDTLIEEQHWDEVRSHFEAHPDEAARMVNPSLGWTKLHWLCSMGSTPSSLIDLVASLHPMAITMADNRYGDTPLHLACRNAQVTPKKTRYLLHHLQEHQRQKMELSQSDGENDGANPTEKADGALQGVLIRNRFGGTALHSACNHNALLEVIVDLVQVNPRLPSVTTFDGIPPVSALYTAYIQTIPGYMAVARRLKGEESAGSGHFARFWEKVVFLSTADRLTEKVPDPSRLVLHGLLHSSNLLVNFYKLALKHDPGLASVPDGNGDCALHLLLLRRPFRLKEREAIAATLEAAEQPAYVRNHAGDFPLLAAIRNKIPWQKGLDLLAQVAPSTVQLRDVQTNLFPFQLAASVGGKVALDNTFELLSIQPDLLLVKADASLEASS